MPGSHPVDLLSPQSTMMCLPPPVVMSAQAPCSTSKISSINFISCRCRRPTGDQSPPPAHFQGDILRDSLRFVESLRGYPRIPPNRAALSYWTSTSWSLIRMSCPQTCRGVL